MDFYYNIYDTTIWDILKSYGKEKQYGNTDTDNIKVEEEEEEKYYKTEDVEEIADKYFKHFKKIENENKKMDNELQLLYDKGNKLYNLYKEEQNNNINNKDLINKYETDLKNAIDEIKSKEDYVTDIPINLKKDFEEILKMTNERYNINKLSNNKHDVQFNMVNKYLRDFVDENYIYGSIFKNIIKKSNYSEDFKNIYIKDLFKPIMNEKKVKTKKIDAKIIKNDNILSQQDIETKFTELLAEYNDKMSNQKGITKLNRIKNKINYFITDNLMYYSIFVDVNKKYNNDYVNDLITYLKDNKLFVNYTTINSIINKAHTPKK